MSLYRALERLVKAGERLVVESPDEDDPLLGPQTLDWIEFEVALAEAKRELGQ